MSSSPKVSPTEQSVSQPNDSCPSTRPGVRWSAVDALLMAVEAQRGAWPDWVRLPRSEAQFYASLRLHLPHVEFGVDEAGYVDRVYGLRLKAVG